LHWIYGIQQAGRRLQRKLFEWLRAQGFKALDDSDPCVFKLVSADGEILTIGVYVDNLQVVHSVPLDADGRRYSSARSLFAFAAKTGCRVRSIDLIAAYLQGEFLDGEVVYCHAAQGYAKYDKNGEPMIARVDKP